MEEAYKNLYANYQNWLASRSNSIVITPQDNILEKYAWLKSFDRNAQMGAKSATNRRVLLLMPGTYTPTACLTLDTDFVDICAVATDPTATIVKGALSPAVVSQIVNDVVLAGFTIKNTYSGSLGEYNTFIINAEDNTPSKYYFMHFRHANPGSITTPYKRACVAGYKHINGFWWECEGDAFTWLCKKNYNLAATMYYCVAGNTSFLRDNENDTNGTGVLSGTLIGCKAGDASFGGCSTFGSNVTGHLEDCKAGNSSYAMGKNFSGTAIRCIGGDDCFGGYQGVGANYGTFSGVAKYCSASGRSFGSGHASCKNSGRLLNCEITAMPEAMYCQTAMLENTILYVTGINKNVIYCNDTYVEIYNCKLITNGTGYSISGPQYYTFLALHCRMNKDKHPDISNYHGNGSLLAGLCIVSPAIV